MGLDAYLSIRNVNNNELFNKDVGAVRHLKKFIINKFNVEDIYIGNEFEISIEELERENKNLQFPVSLDNIYNLKKSLPIKIVLEIL